MKNIIKSLLAPAVALAVLPFMASCETDTDSNPTLQHPTSFVLNTPAYAENNVYDLANSESVNLTTTQPDYGFPVVTTYEVQVSLNQAFTEVTGAEVPETVNYETLMSTYDKANMDVSAEEMNNAIVSLYQQDFGGDPSGKVLDVYVRLAAHVANADNSYCYSNVIKLPVVVSYIATMPKVVYVAAESIHGGTEGKALAPVFGLDAQWYGMVYMSAGASLTWGDADAQDNGAAVTTFDDQADAGLSEAADGGIAFANAGWYVLHFSASIADNTLTSKLTVYPGEAYVIGTVMSQSTWGHDPATQLTAPADASGEWVSPEFLAGGELRASIKVPGLDWWRTEFTLYKGDLYWRNCDMPDNWAVNVGSDYSVSCSVGQKLYVNFDYDTGRVE